MEFLKKLRAPLVMDEYELDDYADKLHKEFGIELDWEKVVNGSWFVAGFFWILAIGVLVALGKVIKIPFGYRIWIPLIVAVLAQMAYQYHGIVSAPRKEYEKRLTGERNKKMREETRKRMLKGTVNAVMLNWGCHDVYEKLRHYVYPEYIQEDITHLFAAMDDYLAIGKHDEQRTFFSLHLPQILKAVQNPNLSDEDKELAKRVIKKATDHLDLQRLIFIQAESMDDVSALKAYDSFLGGDFQ